MSAVIDIRAPSDLRGFHQRLCRRVCRLRHGDGADIALNATPS